MSSTHNILLTKQEAINQQQEDDQFALTSRLHKMISPEIESEYLNVERRAKRLRSSPTQTWTSNPTTEPVVVEKMHLISQTS